MSDVITLDICVRQGAEYRAEYRRIATRYVFEAQTTGVSDGSAPTFPTALDGTVTDNTVLWLNKGQYSAELHPDITVWLPSYSYARRAKVLTPIEAIDLTGYTGAFQLRDTVSAATPIHSGTVTFGTRANGEFSMVIPTANTEGFDFEDAVYDLELSTPGGEVDFVLRGAVTLVKEVTR